MADATTDAETTVKTSPKPCCHGVASKRPFQIFLGVFIGVLLAGLGITTWFIVTEFVLSSDQLLTESLNATQDQNDAALMDDVLLQSEGWVAREIEVGEVKPLYIGVLSLEPYLDSRGIACNQTWGASRLISKLQFFSQLRAGVPTSLPVVNLAGE